MAIDISLIRAELTRIESQGQSNYLDNFVPMPEGEGTVILRLLPPLEGMKLPFVGTRTHKLNGKNLHCPCTNIGGKWQGNCPVCNYYRYLWKESDSVGEDEAKALQTEARSIKPVERYYWNAIVRTFTNKSGEVEHNVGPKIYSCGKQVQGKLLRAWTGDETIGEDPLGDFTDIHTGRDLKVIKRLVKSGGDAYPNYTESKFLNPSVAGTDEEIAQWMAALHDLAALRKLLPADDLAREVRIFRGLEKDPELAFDPNGLAANGEVATPRKTTISVPAGVPTSRPAVTRQAPQPVAVVDDADEALADDDFLKKLRSM